mmetsp:Transcript_70716/g.183531  ORF Transcript_70716/g.183531 Transcript_70716/m.183531 type:complete len:239 (-) Transcript_70716:42-758(-)
MALLLGTSGTRRLGHHRHLHRDPPREVPPWLQGPHLYGGAGGRGLQGLLGSDVARQRLPPELSPGGFSPLPGGLAPPRLHEGQQARVPHLEDSELEPREVRANAHGVRAGPRRLRLASARDLAAAIGGIPDFLFFGGERFDDLGGRRQNCSAWRGHSPWDHHLHLGLLLWGGHLCSLQLDRSAGAGVPEDAHSSRLPARGVCVVRVRLRLVAPPSTAQEGLLSAPPQHRPQQRHRRDR